MFSLNTICFEAMNRDYRNAVVAHVRTALQGAYPNDWETRMIAPFKKEWEATRAAASTSRISGQHEAQLRDEADLLGVNHFYNLFDVHFEVLFQNADGHVEAERKALKQTVLGWAKYIKTMRDSVTGHPGEDDVTEADALMILDIVRRILEALELDAEKVRGLWEAVKNGEFIPDVEGAEDDRGLEGSILPSREAIAPRFVGRRTELDALRTWLIDDYSRSWFLAGDGGKGKTAIAYQFAASTCDNPPSGLEIVIWLTAKARRFAVGSGIELDDPDFSDIESALDGVLTAYGEVAVEKKDLGDKRKQCLEYLTLLPALLVLDDVDSLEGIGTEAMNFFLIDAASTPSKVLFTSRRVAHYGMESRTTQVEGFRAGSDEGINFVRTQVNMFGLDGEQFSNSMVNSILEVCDGSPLFIQDLLRLCKVGETPQAAIEKWVSDSGEEARRYALGREFEKLSDAAQKVLLACSLCPGPASLPEIRFATRLSESNCEEAISELQSLFLVPRPD